MIKKRSPDEIRKAWAEITVKAWEDTKFKEKLLANPQQVCKEHGLDLGSDIHLKIVEDKKETRHMILREKPEGMSSADLKNIAAATWASNNIFC